MAEAWPIRSHYDLLKYQEFDVMGDRTQVNEERPSTPAFGDDLSRLCGTKFPALSDSLESHRAFSFTEHIKSISPSQFPCIMQIIPSGSRAEGLYLKGSDEDFMVEIGPLLIDLEKSSSSNENFFAKQTSHPGFFNVYDQDAKIVSSQQLQMKMAPYVTNPADMRMSVLDAVRESPEAKAALPKGISSSSADMVVSVRFSQWPAEIDKEDIKNRLKFLPEDAQVAALGAPLYLVRKSHKDSKDNDTEWRISFSLVEIEIARGIPHHYRKAYLCAKQYVQDWFMRKFSHGEWRGLTRKSPLPSYFLKTCFLWLLHESPGLVDCKIILLALLRKVVFHLENGHLSNFFIIDQNIHEFERCNVADEISPDLEKFEKLLIWLKDEMWQLGDEHVRLRDRTREDSQTRKDMALSLEDRRAAQEQKLLSDEQWLNDTGLSSHEWKTYFAATKKRLSKETGLFGDIDKICQQDDERKDQYMWLGKQLSDGEERIKPLRKRVHSAQALKCFVDTLKQDLEEFDGSMGHLASE